MLNRLEPAVQRAFGRWGTFLTSKPRWVLSSTLIVLVVLCVGMVKLERQNDAIELWVSDRGRIHKELDFYRDEFSPLSPNLESFIVTPAREGGNLFSVEALAEVEALQKWIMQYTYKHTTADGETKDIMLEDICFKPVDKEDHEPCFQYSILDCFQEGNVFTPGGKKNSAYSGIYSPKKASFRVFNFGESFTDEFVRDTCTQWYNQGTSDTITLGGITKGINSMGEPTIAKVDALRIVFSTKSEETLAEDGLKRIKWTPKQSSGQSDLEICNDATDCGECIDEVGLAQASAAGCEPRSGSQSDSCCEFMQELRGAACIEQVFEAKPSVGSLANLVFTGCNIPTVQLGESRCNNEDEFIDKIQESQAAVCICLTDSDSEECENAAMAYISENLETADTFAAAQSGDAAARAELGALLVSEVGCILEETVTPQSEELEEVDELPEVCVCITQSTSPECSAAGQAFALANPEHIPVFSKAATGDEDAKKAVGRILIEDLKCLGGGSRRKLLVDETDDIEGLPLVCACIADGDSEDCLKGAGEFLAAKPEYNETFTEAMAGNQTAVGEVTTIILTEGGCETRKYSFETIQTELRDKDEAWDILHGWEKGWRNAIKDRIDDFQHIKVSWISSSTLDDETDAAAKGQAKLILGGYLLVGIYIIAYFAFDISNTGAPSFSVLPPGPFAALLAYLSILLGICATFGIIGFVSMTSLKTSPITLQIVPLLMVGLGVNDFFVLASYMKSTIKKNPEGQLSRNMYEAMAGGGSSITLSSVTNTVAFALGAISPIPAIQWFSVHMMIGVVVAYLISITVIPVILLGALSRYLDGKADLFLPVLGKPKPGNLPDNRMIGGVGNRDILTAKLGSIIVFVVYGFWLGISIWGISRFDRGLPASQIVPKGGDTYRYLVPSEEHFQSFPVYLVYKEAKNYDTLERFEESREMEFNFVNRAYMVDKSTRVTSWLNYYSEYVESKFCSNDICMNEVEWYWDDFFSETFGTQNICKGLTSPSACETACNERCPQGPVGSQYRCELSKTKMGCFCPYRPKLKKDRFYESPEGSRTNSYWADFLANTTGGSISQKLISFDTASATPRNPYGLPAGFRSVTTVEELYSIEQKLRHIKSGRKVMDAGPVDGAYAFHVSVYGIGEQYKDIGHKAVIAVAISVAVTLVVMMPLIVHWFAAIIVTFCVISAVVLSAGTSHWIGMNLNHSLYVSLVVTVGLSIEFCAHIARDFMLADGNRGMRVAHALKSVGFAVFNGGVTTFLGIIPVAWADFNYFKKYFFMLYSVVVLVGLFVGLMLLPGILLWIGPESARVGGENNVNNEQKKTVELTQGTE